MTTGFSLEEAGIHSSADRRQPAVVRKKKKRGLRSDQVEAYSWRGPSVTSSQQWSQGSEKKRSGTDTANIDKVNSSIWLERVQIISGITTTHSQEKRLAKNKRYLGGGRDILRKGERTLGISSDLSIYYRRDRGKIRAHIAWLPKKSSNDQILGGWSPR